MSERTVNDVMDDLWEGGLTPTELKSELHAIFKREMEGEKVVVKIDDSFDAGNFQVPVEIEAFNKAIDRAIQVHGKMMGVGDE